ncbi:MAG: serine hydrolase domain-containing protein [Psychrobacter sp.]|nr:serine hydrolase domain-containing protein [Psychrobacter sp.]
MAIQMTSRTLEASLQGLLNKLQAEGAPAGGSLVVYQGEHCLAQVSTGFAQPNVPWTADTLSLNYSTGKGVLATLVHVLVSESMLNLDTPIAHYWPSFAAQQKGSITLRHVMSHQAGLYNIRDLVSDANDLLSWDTMCARVAAMPIGAKIAYSPAARRQANNDSLNIGSKHSQEAQDTHNKSGYYQSVYSALVYGWVVGAVIEQATQMSLAEALKHYLTEPLGIAEACYFGVPASKLAQVAQPYQYWPDEAKTDIAKLPLRTVYPNLSAYEHWQTLADEMGISYSGSLDTAQINRLYFDSRLMDLAAYKSALSLPGKAQVNYHSPSLLQACIPAANGVASARALATIYTMLANKGHWQGRELINAATFSELSAVQGWGMDAVMPPTALASQSPPSMNWRLGYHGLLSVCHDDERLAQAFGHMGYNGSGAWCNPSQHLAVAYVHNYEVTMFTDVRQFAINELILSY